VSVPDWWETILLGTAAWRVFYLLGEDDLLDRPRRYVTRTGRAWRKGDPAPLAYRAWLGEFLECPYCLGAWVAIAWWGAWELWPSTTLIVAAPLMLSAAVVGAHKVLAS